MLILAASLFLTNPAPLDMPRAEAWVVKSEERRYLEDRYDSYDLWYSSQLVGRWQDDDGRVFSLALARTLPPPLGEGEMKTRTEYRKGEVMVVRKNERHLTNVFAELTPVDLPEQYQRPRQLPRGYREVRYYQGTNTSTVVCAFLPEKEDSKRERTWWFATWQLVEGDDFVEKIRAFENEFLGKEFLKNELFAKIAEVKAVCNAKVKSEACERALLKEDVRHSVAAYPEWHSTESEEFAVIDDLGSAKFAISITNELATMRRKYAAAFPSPLDGSNTLAVVRIYANRYEYREALERSGVDMQWSAAYWSPRRREIVAYLPKGGERELKQTLRHEAFHQYLSYATAMISSSPWINEGYAQYFEDEKDDGLGISDMTADRLEEIAKRLPELMRMDYDDFYSGTDSARHLKYRLAKSIAVFLEQGADKVRFQPFKNLCKKYVEALLETQDMLIATERAFGSEENVELFAEEWKKFWLKKGF